MNAIAKAHGVVNATMRRLDTMFPGYFQTTTKRNHYIDFGYPDRVDFSQLWQMYRRNGIANAAIEKTILKVWQDNPYLQIGENAKEESRAEKEFNDYLDGLRFWQNLAEVDRRSMVGKYGAAIFRFADSKRMNEPVESVPGGLNGLVGIIPAWEGQLTVADWDSDERSETYGDPKMFSFNEASFGNNKQARSFEVHPDRVLIWSRDGTVHGESMLEPGYNDLIDFEKVKGAGGEGFWKNAKSAPVLTIDKEARVEAMAQAMGTTPDKLADKMDEQVEEFSKGFDAMLLLQGIEAKTLGVTLPDPKEFLAGPLQSFAASFGIPMKVLVGTQTGERASTEDAEEWAKTCMARRNNVILPNIREIIGRLKRVNVLRDEDWHINWSDLTESSAKEKGERASSLADINEKHVRAGGLEIVFTGNEIREAAGYEPRDELDAEIDPADPNEDDANA